MKNVAPAKTNYLTLFALTLLIVGSVDSMRNLPATALFGPTLIFFFVVSAVIFLIPAALVAAELASSWTTTGGIYHWMRLAFGEKWGFLAVWFQWINTMVWYPTILSFMAGLLAHFFPSLVQNKLYLVSFILIMFWLLTFINLRGLYVSGAIASICAIIGVLIPMILIIALSAFWVIKGQPLQINFTVHDVIPTSNGTSWISLTAIMASFVGIELAAVHVNNIRKPHKTFPLAMFFSIIIILFTMIGGALAIAGVLPQKSISLTSGVMQAFGSFFHAYNLQWMVPIIAVMIFFGSLGGTINWVISTAKGLLQTAQYGYLPPLLQKENSYGVASNILIMQAILVNLLCLTFLLMPSINGSYWLLTALSTQVYMLMYVLMFAAAIKLRYKYPDQPQPFKIPGGKIGIWLVSLLGLIGCAATLIVGFFPPAGIDVGTRLHYCVTFSSGLFLMIAPSLIFYAYKYYTTAKSGNIS